MPGSRDPRDDHAAIRRLADELLPALMARLEASPLGELQVHQDGWRVRLRKPTEGSSSADGVGPAATTQKAGGKAKASAHPATSPSVATRAAHGPAERTGSTRSAIHSPAVGVFHPQSGSTLGKPVRAGDVIGHVEVLGVPQEVVAPFDGVLGRLLVESGSVVEYGEPLMRIDSAGHPGSAEAAVLDIGEGR